MADNDNKEIIQVIFDNDAESLKGSGKDENLNPPEQNKEEEMKPKGSNKKKIADQVGETVVARTIRGSVANILTKYAEYTGDLTLSHNVKASTNMVGLANGMLSAAFSGNYLDLAKQSFDMIISMADYQIQKDKLNMSSEYMRRKTGIAEFEYGRYGSRGKKL